jgi:hypothetical protein
MGARLTDRERKPALPLDLGRSSRQWTKFLQLQNEQNPTVSTSRKC